MKKAALIILLSITHFGIWLWSFCHVFGTIRAGTPKGQETYYAAMQHAEKITGFPICNVLEKLSFSEHFAMLYFLLNSFLWGFLFYVIATFTIKTFKKVANKALHLTGSHRSSVTGVFLLTFIWTFLAP